MFLKELSCALLMLPVWASAASFDCGKAATRMASTSRTVENAAVST